jgi:serine phosphatase RsbU (regulator of sigma subunit)
LTAAEQLERFEVITDTSLAYLSVEQLLNELLERVRDMLQVDTAVVLLVEGSGSHLVATAARGLEEEVVQNVRIPMRRGFAGKIAAEQRAVAIERLQPHDVVNPILRHAGIRSLLGVPLIHQGRSIGVMHVGTRRTRRFTDEDVELLQTVADRIALAVQSRASHAQRAAARVLQRSLLPSHLPSVPGLGLAARYATGGEEDVGGDWYDVFTLPTGELCIAVGDVVGHGLQAAVVMGRVRAALRAYAIESAQPAEALSRLHRMMQHFLPDQMATLLYGVFDTSLDTVRLSSAGHPPPFLAAPDRPPAPVDVSPDPPLGVPFTRSRHTTAVEVPPGAVLCVYTDGLVERRKMPIDDGLARLRETLFAGEADEVCASVMYSLVGDMPPEDDIALLVVARDGA